MNKKELIGTVAAESGLTQKEATLALNALCRVIVSTLQQGDQVTLLGFGSFTVKERPARLGRNPRSGAAISIPAKKTVRFTPGTRMEIAKPAPASPKTKQ